MEVSENQFILHLREKSLTIDFLIESHQESSACFRKINFVKEWLQNRPKLDAKIYWLEFIVEAKISSGKVFLNGGNCMVVVSLQPHVNCPIMTKQHENGQIEFKIQGLSNKLSFGYDF